MANINELNQYGKNIVGFKTSRSRFPLDNENVLTLKAGDIVPVWSTDVLPGDTIQVGFSFVMRMLTPVSPIMDNAFIDFYSFFVPNRLLCDKYHLTTTDEEMVDKPNEYGNWKTFFTENENGAWDEQDTTYLKKYTTSRVAPQSVADYLGLPVGGSFANLTLEQEAQTIYNTNESICNGLRFATLDLIYNEWFRNENLEAPTLIRQNGEISASSKETHKYNTIEIGNTKYLAACLIGANDKTAWNDSVSSGTVQNYPYKATKYSDVFTNALPEPYKLNEDIVLGLAGEAEIKMEDIPVYSQESLRTKVADGNYETPLYQYGLDNQFNALNTEGERIKIVAGGTATADLSQATAITINQLREAITIQHIAEAFARGGTRYSEILHAIYGTAPDDITLERPELLGAKRFPVNTTQVVNSAISSSGDLGELGAYSHTVGSDEYIISKSFKEHGQLMIVAVIRTSNKYYQGIPKEMSKNKLFDYYFPQFAGLGDQAILNKEIYLSGNETKDNEVFGYQEAFYEEHYKKDELHGLVNPCSGDKTLAAYTYQVPFTTTPVLNKEFDTQQYESVGNVLYDTTTISQFLLDIYFQTTATREIPVHNIPGVNRI